MKNRTGAVPGEEDDPGERAKPEHEKRTAYAWTENDNSKGVTIITTAAIY